MFAFNVAGFQGHDHLRRRPGSLAWVVLVQVGEVTRRGQPLPATDAQLILVW